MRALRHVEYTAAIDLQGLLKSAVLARAVGARRTIGFQKAHLREPLARVFYTDTPEPGEREHVVYKNLALLSSRSALATCDHRFRSEVPLTQWRKRQESGSAGSYALISPGAGVAKQAVAGRALRSGGCGAARDARTCGRSSLWGPGEEALASAVVAASGGAARAGAADERRATCWALPAARGS